LGLFGVSLDSRDGSWRITKTPESHLGLLPLSRAFFEGGERLLSLQDRRGGLLGAAEGGSRVRLAREAHFEPDLGDGSVAGAKGEAFSKP